jgi:hypothetical protein
LLGGQFFGELVNVPGMLLCLFGEFVSGQMVPFAVGDGRSGVGMGGKVVELCESIVRALWHDSLRSRRMRFSGRD